MAFKALQNQSSSSATCKTCPLSGWKRLSAEHNTDDRRENASNEFVAIYVFPCKNENFKNGHLLSNHQECLRHPRFAHGTPVTSYQDTAYVNISVWTQQPDVSQQSNGAKTWSCHVWVSCYTFLFFKWLFSQSTIRQLTGNSVGNDVFPDHFSHRILSSNWNVTWKPCI